MCIRDAYFQSNTNATYLWDIPLDDYLKWAWVEKNKEVTYLKAELPHVLAEIGKDDLDKIDSEFRAVRPRFEKPNGDIRSIKYSII